MTGMVKIKIKENGSIIKIHTVYRTIQPNNPTIYMGKIDVYIHFSAVSSMMVVMPLLGYTHLILSIQS